MRRTNKLQFASVLLAAGPLLAASLLPALARRQAAVVSPDQTSFFESKVRPVLAANCFQCHGEKVQKAGLRLDSFAAVRTGSSTGPVIAPYLPGKSRLIAAVQYRGQIKMPPTGKLRLIEIAALTDWVKMGAPWPEPISPQKAGVRKQPASGRSFWSFQPVKRSVPPAVKDIAWVKSPIDRFILAKLEAKGLKPAPPADRRTLIRRAYFDLVGLPPSPDEVAAFITDPSPNAFAKVVDRLLASPQYGERWGRHWLDVVRYADSNGLDENVAFANAWRYRDYVVNALNKDKPYDQFVKEQIAGDLLQGGSNQDRNERLTATGFLSLGAKVLAESDKEKMVMDIVDEQIETASKAFMGLTVSCARCHDHKFDPIPTRDYYALAGIFKSTKTMSNLATVAMWVERPLSDPALEPQKKEYEQKLTTAKAHVKELKDRKAADDLIKKAEEELKQVEKQGPPVPSVMAVEEGAVANCRIHVRGDTQRLGDESPRGFLTVLSNGAETRLDAKSSGRLEFAEWLTRPDHPLTARVEVNRIWQGHFAEGLVRTPDNWGLLGEKPTHPELLDWLAREFTAAWSIKRMHRMIMLSSTYLMSCANDAKGLQLDPENRLLWRMSRRRLEAEPLRDAMLAISGKLDLTMGGTLLDTGNHNYVTNDQSGNAARYHSARRSIYLPVIRNALYDMFQAFDVGDPSMVNAKRGSTTVAPQALFVMNSPFAIEQAAGFAERILAAPMLSDSERIKQAYLRALSRTPTVPETVRALAFLRSFEKMIAGYEKDQMKIRAKAWQSLCQTLLASNEFTYLD